MNRSDLKKYTLPDTPGIYLFKQGSTITYVGKATSLRDRVKSYFSSDLLKTRGGKVATMVLEATSLSWEQTDSVLEALILEANTIKKYQPVGNTRDKDNKSFNYVVVTNEAFPRVLVARGRELYSTGVQMGKEIYALSDMKHVFGPYPDGRALKDALHLVRSIFPFRDKCTPLRDASKRERKCFNAQIGLCPGVCDGSCSKEDYARIIRNIVLFFLGKKKQLLALLTRRMRSAAHAEQFEEAAQLRSQIRALTHIRDVALIKREHVVSDGGIFSNTNTPFRIEAFDVAHISGTNTVGIMVASHQTEEGSEIQKNAQRKFIIRSSKNDDLASLTELLTRRFAHPEWQFPNLIVIDGGETHLAHARAVLSRLNISIPVVSVVKDARHKARDILGDKSVVAVHRDAILALNAEAHSKALSFHRFRRTKKHFHH